jgi:hypothetical protein
MSGDFNFTNSDLTLSEEDDLKGQGDVALIKRIETFLDMIFENKD